MSMPSTVIVASPARVCRKPIDRRGWGILPGVEMLDGEPRFGPWRVRRIDDVLGAVVPRRPALVAVDGRSGSGKTTAAQRLVGRVPGATVVHTDDIAWYHAMFDWSALIADGVLARRCAWWWPTVRYRGRATAPTTGAGTARGRRPT
jgi:hypothetical protein